MNKQLFTKLAFYLFIVGAILGAVIFIVVKHSNTTQ